MRSRLLFWMMMVLTGPGLMAQDMSRAWADSVLQTLSMEEKIGQLFMLATFSNQSEKDYAYVERMVRNQHLGGLIFMQGTAQKQVELINRYQKVARLPMLIAQDAEWGLGMRLKKTPSYPKNMTLGAIAEDSLLYLMGQQMARDLRLAGITMNFAPVVDINNNVANPVINYRSFGENRFNVARKGIMLSQGLQAGGVIGCAKHFPGHGDTDTDSHYDLPVIPHDLNRLDTMELYPFAQMAKAGVPAIMVAHLFVPALDNTPEQPTTLSPKVIQGVIREKLDYDGLVVTDALNMHGVTKFNGPGETALKAFMAGNDILLFPRDIPKAASLIKEKIEAGEIPPGELDIRVRRILLAKYGLGLHHNRPVPQDSIAQKLADPMGIALRRRLYEAAITLPQNKGRLIPLRDLDQTKVAYVQIGRGSASTFQKRLESYTSVRTFYASSTFSAAERTKLLRELRPYDVVIVGVMGMKQRLKSRFGVSPGTEAFVKQVAQTRKKQILTLFGNPYALRYFGSETATVVAYEAASAAQEAAAAAIFGGIPITGRLPVSASEIFPEGAGEQVRQAVRFGFANPEEVQMSSPVLKDIDSLAEHFIKEGAMPGCQILLMRGNRIVYAKGFGKTREDRKGAPIDPYNHIYDLASITKVAATTACTMYLVEQGKIDLDRPVAAYATRFAGSEVGQLPLRRLLQHNAGLPGWVPFYRETYEDPRRRQLDPDLYAYTAAEKSYYTISSGLYGKEALREQVWQTINDIEPRNTRGVRYSDIGMIIMGEVVASVAGMPLDELAQKLYYEPLGMNRTTFRPYEKGLTGWCPPTEADTMWRHSIVQGYVHDPSAAILGGVAGHAGLFSNIYDLAKMMLMLKNGGFYGRERFLRQETIDYYTQKQLSYSRKGLGWDKPEIMDPDASPVSRFASSQTFGHTGFTGTCVWVDPTFDLVYIFLSNRTFPFASNRKLLRENVRIQIMDKAYESIFAYQQPDWEAKRAQP